MSDHILSCTFCKKTQHQVEKLVAGPGVYICDRCIELAHAIVHGDPPAPSSVSFWQRTNRQLRRMFPGYTNKRWLRRASSHAA